MIHAYDRTYLNNARHALARMLDFAVYDLHYDLSRFLELFIASGIAELFEAGDCSVTAGRSGVELAYEVLDRAGVTQKRVTPTYADGLSEEYWIGWALAYYQWETSIRFEELFRYVPASDLLMLYAPYHEMDIRQFVDRVDAMYLAAKKETNLKYYRRSAGLSQRDLAELSCIPVRTIQQYEQRQKSINKAQTAYLVTLAKILYCRVEDLMERV